MQYLFVFYVDPRNVFHLNSIEAAFDKELIVESCPTAELYVPESHLLHKYGSFVKNLGLRTSFIIETTDDREAVILKMISDQLPLSTAKDAPRLQTIYRDVDWEKLRTISDPLWENRITDLKRRNDRQVMHTLQRQVDRMRSTLLDLRGQIEEPFLAVTNEYLDATCLEIDRISDAMEENARQAGIARKKLGKIMKTYEVFSL